MCVTLVLPSTYTTNNNQPQFGAISRRISDRQPGKTHTLAINRASVTYNEYRPQNNVNKALNVIWKLGFCIYAPLLFP